MLLRASATAPGASVARFIRFLPFAGALPPAPDAYPGDPEFRVPPIPRPLPSLFPEPARMPGDVDTIADSVLTETAPASTVTVCTLDPISMLMSCARSCPPPRFNP